MPSLSKRKRPVVTQEESPDASEDEAPAVDSDDQRKDNEIALEELAKRLVRLALACELQRRPITRAEVRDKVYNGSTGTQFKKVFEAAQRELRTVFAMEMSELPAKEKITVAQKRAAQKNDIQKAPTSWMLTSILPAEYHDPIILPSSRTPTVPQESVYIAVYSMIVATIALNRGSLPDSKLDRYLERMGLADETPVAGYEKIDALLKRLQRDGYIVKITESIGGGEEEISWVLGPRGKLEVGDHGVKGLVEMVYGDVEDGTELARRIARSLGIGERPVQQAPAKRQRKTRRQADTEARAEEDDDDDQIDDEDNDDND